MAGVGGRGEPQAVEDFPVKGKGALSHWVDESTPDRALAVLADAGLDAEEFSFRLAPALGAYRSRKHVEEAMPTRSEEADYAHRLRGQVAEVMSLLDSREIPARLHAGLLAHLHRTGHNWIAMQETIVRDFRLLAQALATAEKGMRATPGKRGRRREDARAELLAAISAEIARQQPNWTQTKRDATALEVLVSYGIATPSAGSDNRPDKTVRRATGRK